MRLLLLTFLVCALAAPAAGQESVVLESPSRPGEIWPCGFGCRISWWTYMPEYWDVAWIDLSIDGKRSWFPLTGCTTNLGGWNWVVPTMTDSDDCYIRVQVNTTCTEFGRIAMNEYPFTITEPPAVVVGEIGTDSLRCGECIDVPIEVHNNSGRPLTLWYDLDMADPAFLIHDDPDNDLQFTIGAGVTMTVTRPFCLPCNVPEGSWTLKAILWSVREDGRYAGPKLYDSGWIHPTTVGVEPASWSVVKRSVGAPAD